MCLLANQEYRTRRTSEAKGRGVIVNSSSRIDRMARLMFPLSFTAFNILYWVSYSQGEVIFNWNDHRLNGQYRKAEKKNDSQLSLSLARKPSQELANNGQICLYLDLSEGGRQSRKKSVIHYTV